MNIFFDIPDDHKAVILTEWLQFKGFGRLHSAICNEKRRRQLLLLLASEQCIFDHGQLTQYSESVEEWSIKNKIKFSTFYLYGQDLEDETRRRNILTHLSSTLVSIQIDLTKKGGPPFSYIKDFGVPPSSDLSIDLSVVIADITSMCPNIKHLHLRHNHFKECMLPTDNYASALYYIAHHPRLESLQLEGMENISSEMLTALTNAPVLHSVEFDNCTFASEATNKTYKRKHNTIQKLVMTNVKASHINTIATIFAKVVRVELSLEDEADSAAAIETMSTVWSSMKQLEWTRCRLPENLLIQLFEKCTSLTEFTQILGRWRNERVTLKSPPPPVPCVLYPTDYTGSRLHTLDIYCSKADTLRTITTLCPYLHTLHLTSPEEGIASVGSALSCVANSRITHFTLKDYADISDTHILCFQQLSPPLSLPRTEW